MVKKIQSIQVDRGGGRTQSDISDQSWYDEDDEETQKAVIGVKTVVMSFSSLYSNTVQVTKGQTVFRNPRQGGLKALPTGMALDEIHPTENTTVYTLQKRSAPSVTPVPSTFFFTLNFEYC